MFSGAQMKLSPTKPQFKQLENSNNWNFCEKENNYNHKTLTHNMIGQLPNYNGCQEQEGKERRTVKPRGESKKKGTKWERRMKEETEKQEKE